MNESFQKLNDTFNMDGADVDLDDDIKQSENEGDDSYLKKQKYLTQINFIQIWKEY